MSKILKNPIFHLGLSVLLVVSFLFFASKTKFSQDKPPESPVIKNHTPNVIKTDVPTEAIRSWSDSRGKIILKATFLECRKGKVRLQRSNGSVVKVLLAQLSEKDQNWISQQIFGKPLLQSKQIAHEIPSVNYEEKMQSSKMVEEVGRAVVRIEVQKEKSKMTGTGFFLSSDGKIATSYRLVQNGFSAEIVGVNGKKYKVKGYLQLSPENDLAILQIACDASCRDLRYLDFENLEAKEEDKIYAFGCLENSLYSVVNGLVIDPSQELSRGDRRQRRGDLEKTLLWVQLNSAAVSTEYGGGPLVNESGKVVGILSMQERGDEAPFSVPSSSELKKIAVLSYRVTCRPLALMDFDKEVGRSRVLYGGSLKTLPIYLPSGREFDIRDYWTKLVLKVTHGNSPQLIEKLSQKAAFVARHRNEKVAALCGLNEERELDESSLYLDKDEKPQFACQYDDGKKNGFLFVFDRWRPNEKIPEWVFEYSYGKRHGLACGFRQGNPQLILEYNHDRLESIHLVEGREITKSFTSEKEAAKVKIIKAMFQSMGDVEEAFKKSEIGLKRLISELDEKDRKNKVISSKVNERLGDRTGINRKR